MPLRRDTRSLILALNTGSSSLKISLYRLADPVTLLIKSSISSISAPPASFSFETTSALNEYLSSPNSSSDVSKVAISDVTNPSLALNHFLEYLNSHTPIDRSAITHVCHRVVHGGTYPGPVVIDDQTYHRIEELSKYSSRHNAPALTLIKTSLDALPDALNIAFFDTSFHHTLPPHIYSYPIDQTVARERGLRKYGFHGLSYGYILREVSLFLKKPPTSLSLILLHLGSGASLCAVHKGRSLDTTMGLTPLDGLPGATRSGNVDPALVFHLGAGSIFELKDIDEIDRDGEESSQGRLSHKRVGGEDSRVHITEAEKILNKQAGWKALTGTTDFGAITKKTFESSLGTPPSPSAFDPFNPLETSPHDNNLDAEPELNALAFALLLDRIISFIGSYHLKLGGNVDALVFAGGIGERSVELRREIGKRIGILGWEGIDDGKNVNLGERAGVADIGNGSGGKRLLVCWTDEQEEMARGCVEGKNFLVTIQCDSSDIWNNDKAHNIE